MANDKPPPYEEKELKSFFRKAFSRKSNKNQTQSEYPDDEKVPLTKDESSSNAEGKSFLKSSSNVWKYLPIQQSDFKNLSGSEAKFLKELCQAFNVALTMRTLDCKLNLDILAKKAPRKEQTSYQLYPKAHEIFEAFVYESNTTTTNWKNFEHDAHIYFFEIDAFIRNQDLGRAYRLSSFHKDEEFPKKKIVSVGDKFMNSHKDLGNSGLEFTGKWLNWKATRPLVTIDDTLEKVQMLMAMKLDYDSYIEAIDIFRRLPEDYKPEPYYKIEHNEFLSNLRARKIWAMYRSTQDPEYFSTVGQYQDHFKKVYKRFTEWEEILYRALFPSYDIDEGSRYRLPSDVFISVSEAERKQLSDVAHCFRIIYTRLQNIFPKPFNQEEPFPNVTNFLITRLPPQFDIFVKGKFTEKGEELKLLPRARKLLFDIMISKEISIDELSRVQFIKGYMFLSQLESHFDLSKYKDNSQTTKNHQTEAYDDRNNAYHCTINFRGVDRETWDSKLTIKEIREVSLEILSLLKPKQDYSPPLKDDYDDLSDEQLLKKIPRLTQKMVYDLPLFPTVRLLWLFYESTVDVAYFYSREDWEDQRAAVRRLFRNMILVFNKFREDEIKAETKQQ